MAKPYDPKDFYYRKAKKAGLRARSAFKIDEILKRYRLLGKGHAVLDLGAAPGGFLQILADVVGEKGVAVGVDLEPIRNLGKPWVKTAIVDLLAPDALERISALHPGRFHLVTSDMAPKTIGIKITDEARSLELVRMALRIAEATLERGGSLRRQGLHGRRLPRAEEGAADAVLRGPRRAPAGDARLLLRGLRAGKGLPALIYAALCQRFSTSSGRAASSTT